MCEFPGCTEDAVGHGQRCELHERVLISSSYMNRTEVQDE